MVAPSFTSATQTVADGTDHIDPAQLRGLGPDQVLVLVNGKEGTPSLVNVNGSPGRGAGTDLLYLHLLLKEPAARWSIRTMVQINRQGH
jgi:hypothetical protein